ncbi:MAG: thioesterase family protein [Bacteroidales bacterium]|nr:thioesterase family protein [Bacteroidales bacterium]
MLKTSKDIDIRFSEVDLMKVVWHGAYPLYLADDREAFGHKSGLSYTGYLDNQCYAPIVDMQIQYKHPLRYGSQARIDIIYKPCISAKIIFDYEIRDRHTNLLYCQARTVQVFMDMNYNLMIYSPEFYVKWKEKWETHKISPEEC